MNCISRNHQIDAIKGTAILMVVLYHFFYRYNQLYLEREINFLFIKYWGVIGVAIFFVISGYFMSFSKGGLLFVKNKITRLWPVYFVSITVCFIITHLWELPGRTVGIKDYIYNVIWVNRVIETPYVDGAHWYLTSLIASILIYSVTLMTNKKKNQFLGFMLWMLVLAFLIMGNTYYFDNKYINILIILGGGCYAPMIVAGTAFKWIEDNETKHMGIGLCISCIIEIIFIQSIFYALVLVGAIILLWVIKYINIKLGMIKILEIIGMASYSIYLIHQNLGYVFIYKISEMFDGYKISFSLIASLMMVCIGLITYRYIETPIYYHLKKISKTNFEKTTELRRANEGK